MIATSDGLTIWYGTPEAPSPFDGEVVPRAGVSLVIGVHPASAANTVRVVYRVDRGFAQTLPGRELRTDYDRASQYFAVTFPRFVTGSRVDYSAILSCAGRQVPAPHLATRLRSYFLLEPVKPRSSDRDAKAKRLEQKP